MRKHTLIAAILFLLSTTFYGQDTIGTVLVKDIKSYEGLTIGSHNSSSPQNFVEVNGLLYFTVNNANELWKTDGTPMGTQCVKIFNAVNTSLPLIKSANNLILRGDVGQFFKTAKYLLLFASFRASAAFCFLTPIFSLY